MLYNWDCVAMFEILVSDVLRARISTDFRCLGKRCSVSKSQKDLLRVSLNLKVHVVNDQNYRKTYPVALKC